MGSVSRMASLERFIQAHGESLRQEIRRELPETLKAFDPQVGLVNETDRIAIVVSWTTSVGGSESVALEGMPAEVAAEIDASEFGGDCEMGW